MHSFPTREKDFEEEKSKTRLRMNTYLVIGIILFSIVGSYWILSDISGVYVVNEARRSPVVLSLVRKPTRLEGDLSVRGGGFYSLVESIYKNDTVHLVFHRKEGEMNRQKKLSNQNVVIQIDGKFVDGRLLATMTSSIGTKPVKLTLDRDPGSSIHRVLQAHMP